MRRLSKPHIHMVRGEWRIEHIQKRTLVSPMVALGRTFAAMNFRDRLNGRL